MLFITLDTSTLPFVLLAPKRLRIESIAFSGITRPISTSPLSVSIRYTLIFVSGNLSHTGSTAPLIRCTFS